MTENDLKSVVLKVDQSAMKGIIERRGVIDAYSIFFDSCTDEQLAMLFQHQIRFFDALSQVKNACSEKIGAEGELECCRLTERARTDGQI